MNRLGTCIKNENRVHLSLLLLCGNHHNIHLRVLQLILFLMLPNDISLWDYPTWPKQASSKAYKENVTFTFVFLTDAFLPMRFIIKHMIKKETKILISALNGTTKDFMGLMTHIAHKNSEMWNLAVTIWGLIHRNIQTSELLFSSNVLN